MPDPIDLNALAQKKPDYKVSRTDTILREIPAGRIIKIETSPGGADIAFGTVPAGKKWVWKMVMSIVEEPE